MTTAKRIKATVALGEEEGQNSIEDYHPSVAKAFADQIDHCPHLEGTVVVSNFTLREWVELQQWYKTTNDLNKLQQNLTIEQSPRDHNVHCRGRKVSRPVHHPWFKVDKGQRQCIEQVPGDAEGGYAREELVKINIVNLEEILPQSNQWGYTGPKHTFRLEELCVDEEAFKKIVANFSHPLNTFLKGAGPLVAPTHVISAEDTIFFGILRGFLLHFPIDNAKAIVLLEEAVKKHHSMKWWLKTPCAISLHNIYKEDVTDKVNKFLNMLWHNYCKSLSVTAAKCKLGHTAN
ncbi:hypothetical protein FOMPIDRAFT_1016793 [Fomitopsis schrenkii]|uniref:Uncharacterized protein n=1 Tax=Fomitopsis schrenkii TaxID=2126942 RepID=S8FNG8_FOMSC|nr:hypothetical protein FOMPIDRAFT_1016793 [Fomitopsis schrenkii]